MNMNSYRGIKSGISLLVLSCAVGFAGCAKPTPVEFGSLCQKDNDQKYISVEGYLGAGITVLCSTHGSVRACGLELYDKPGSTSKISAYIEEGTGDNEMEPPARNYTKDSLKIRTNDGQLVTPQDKVRITGTAKTATDANGSHSVCFVNVNKIQKL
jgi:hypothetical protein